MNKKKYSKYRIVEVKEGCFVPQFKWFYLGSLAFWVYLSYNAENNYLYWELSLLNVSDFADSYEEAIEIIKLHKKSKEYPKVLDIDNIQIND